MDELVPIIMGSSSDFKFAKDIGAALEKFGITYEYRVASAHKSTNYLLDIIKEYDNSGKRVVYIAIAGMSNALGGMLDSNTNNPVITCPPYSDKFSGADIYSSLRMPSGVAATVILSPKNAALAAAKIFALNDGEIKNKVVSYKTGFLETIKGNDSKFKGKKVSELE